MNITHTISDLKSRFSQGNRDARRNPWFLAWIGLVAVFLSVNLLFVVFAVYSNPGLVTEDYYEQGRDYEQNAIKLQAARDAVDWTTRFEMPERIVTGSSASFRFTAVDAIGLPIRNADVRIHAYRPSDAAADFVTDLDRITDGLYQGRLQFDLPGIWDVTVHVSQGELVIQENRRIRVEVP